MGKKALKGLILLVCEIFDLLNSLLGNGNHQAAFRVVPQKYVIESI